LHTFIYEDISKKADLQALIDNLSQNYRQILDYMLIHSVKNINNFVCQKTISRVTGFSPSTVKRAIKYFFEVNIITYKKQRGINKSNLYKFNKLLFIFKDSFSVILPCLKWCKKELHKPVMYLNELLCILGRRVIYNSSSKTVVVRPSNGQLPQSQSLTRANMTSKNFQKNKKENNEDKKKKNGVQIMESLAKITNPAIELAHQKFNLTDLGRAKLMVFEQDALSSCIARSGSFHDLINACIDFSDKKGLKVDWNFYFMIKKRYNLVDDKKYCLPLSKPAAGVYKKFVAEPEVVRSQEDKDRNKKLLFDAADHDPVLSKVPWLAELTKQFAMNQFL